MYCRVKASFSQQFTQNITRQVHHQHYLQYDKYTYQRNDWFSLKWLQFYPHEYKASEVAGFDEHFRVYRENVEFDTNKLLSGLPEAEIESTRTKLWTCDFNHIMLRKSSQKFFLIGEQAWQDSGQIYRHCKEQTKQTNKEKISVLNDDIRMICQRVEIIFDWVGYVWVSLTAWDVVWELLKLKVLVCYKKYCLPVMAITKLLLVPLL